MSDDTKTRHAILCLDAIRSAALECGDGGDLRQIIIDSTASLDLPELSDVERIALERFKPANGCWLWTLNIGVAGYGRLVRRGVTYHAHRLTYEMFKGAIPDGLHIDHLCRNPRCVNPAHLEAVTPRENMLRGVSIQAQNARKTHCVNGHEFTPENTLIRKNGGGRTCRKCDNQRAVEYRARLAGRSDFRRAT